MWKNKKDVMVSSPVVTKHAQQDDGSKDWNNIQGSLSNKLTNMGVEGLSPAEITYITQKIQNGRRSKRLTLQLQAVAGGQSQPQQQTAKQPQPQPQSQQRTIQTTTTTQPQKQATTIPAAKPVQPQKPPQTQLQRSFPNAQQPHQQQPRSIPPNQQIRKVNTDWNLTSPRQQKQPPAITTSSGTGTTGTAGIVPGTPKEESLSSQLQSGSPIPTGIPPSSEIEKEYMHLRDRCMKLEAIAKKARDILARNQKLEAELELLRSSGAPPASEKIMEIEKKYAVELKKKTAEADLLRMELEETQLENEVLKEQIQEQDKLIERLENGLKLAMDQIDVLSKSCSVPPPVSPLTSSTSPLFEDDDDDINYDDLDEATLLKLLAQTREELNAKRSSVSAHYDAALNLSDFNY